MNTLINAIASSDFTSETCYLINTQSTSAATTLSQEGSRFLSLIAAMGVFAIGDLV